MTKSLWKPWFLLALGLGVVQAWAGRFFITLDGTSYLDMAQAYLRRDWHTAINGYWNPMYAWLQAIAYWIVRPSPYWEYPLVQLVDLLIYAVALVAFEYLLRGLLRRQREDETAIRIVAYAIFLWSSLELIRIWNVDPDMLVAAAVYAAFGLLTRESGKRTPLMLGAVLAAGYYTKAVMFPLSVLILVLVWIKWPRRRAVAASAVFLVLCFPLIIVLSMKTGHLTIGDTARLNYAWYVDRVESRLWQGGPARAGVPVHPVRVLLNSPRVYEFAGVFHATNPVWYDESYWYRGLHVWLAPRMLVPRFASNFGGLARVLIFQGGGFLLGLLVCLALRRKDAARESEWTMAELLWLASAASVLLLCLVHIEPRHIAPFVTVLFLVPFIVTGITRTGMAAAIAIVGMVWAGCFHSATTVQGEGIYPFTYIAQNNQLILATDIEQMGLAPGDKFATVCCTLPQSVLWAHLVHMYLVATYDWNANFWGLSEADQQRVLTALASTGAKVAVSEVPPPDPAHANGWQRLGSSQFYAHLLSNGASSGSMRRITQKRTGGILSPD